VRPKEPWVQTDAGNPLPDQSGILSRRDRSIPPATAAEDKFAGLFPGGSEVIVDRLSGLFRHLELDRLAVFFCRTVARFFRDRPFDHLGNSAPAAENRFLKFQLRAICAVS
jgi:hypothetical protein